MSDRRKSSKKLNKKTLISGETNDGLEIIRINSMIRYEDSTVWILQEAIRLALETPVCLIHLVSLTMNESNLFLNVSIVLTQHGRDEYR